MQPQWPAQGHVNSGAGVAPQGHEAHITRASVLKVRKSILRMKRSRVWVGRLPTKQSHLG